MVASSAEAAEELVTAMETRFAVEGIVVARDEATKGDGIFLGFQLDGRRATWRPTAKRYWRVAGPLRYAMRPGGMIEGKERFRGCWGTSLACACCAGRCWRSCTTAMSSHESQGADESQSGRP